MTTLNRDCERRELGRPRLAEIANRDVETCRTRRHSVVTLAVNPVVRALEAEYIRPTADLLAGGVVKAHWNACIHPAVFPNYDVRRLDARPDGQDGPVGRKLHRPALVVLRLELARLARIKDDLSTRGERHSAHYKEYAPAFHFPVSPLPCPCAYSQPFSCETSELSQPCPMPMPWTIARSCARISL